MKVRKYYCNSTKIAHLIRKYNDLAGNATQPVFVGRHKGKSLISKFRISQNLTNFDCDVADAIYTIYKNGYESFTPGQVLRVLSGDWKQTILKDHNKKWIVQSIEKLRATRIEIGCKAEMLARGIQVAHIAEASFLAAKKVDPSPRYTMSSYTSHPLDKVKKYRDFFMPLYGYAEMLNQFNAFPQILLHDERQIASSRLSNTLENIQIKRYIIRRLELLRNASKRAAQNCKDKAIETDENFRSIIYVRKSHQAGLDIDGMLAILGIYEENFQSADSWKHKRHSIHHTVIKILDYYKQIEYIQDYAIIKKGRTVYGVTILGEVRYPNTKE